MGEHIHNTNVLQSVPQNIKNSYSLLIGEGNGNPLQYSWLQNPMDRGVWWATVHGVTKSQTRLKRLSSQARMHSLRCADCEIFRISKQMFLFYFNSGVQHRMRTLNGDLGSGLDTWCLQGNFRQITCPPWVLSPDM